MATETTSSQFNPLKYWLITWSFFRRYPVFPAVILIVLVIAAIIGPTVAPYERDIGDVRARHNLPGTVDIKFPTKPKGGIDLTDTDIAAGSTFFATYELPTDNQIFDIGKDGSYNNDISWNESTPNTPDILFSNITQEGAILTFEIIANEDIIEGQNDNIILDVQVIRTDTKLLDMWPDGYHFMGNDHVGRDVFSRLLHGAQISMMVVGISLVAGMTIGVALGLIAGYTANRYEPNIGFWMTYKGKKRRVAIFSPWLVDEFITRFVDIWYALPFLMVALVVTLIFGRGLEVLMGVLALIAWSGFVRVIRAQTLIIRELDFVASAKINGATAFRIMYKHILPGVLNTAVVVATLNTSGLILAESVLSFVGAGIQPPTPAWGVMTNEGRDYLAIAPHQVMVPGGAIFLVVLALNFLGDWLRDRLDPRLRQVD
ncbi:MAG: ABC transporter permease [Dehalococcoidia bacterium]|nr:ABC transporter permease [Dehalococcoidia bacterium]|tara:strand:- start:2934 stop:4223 length:1290 start_codon:yes stop_codon:yes gene_type:complete